MTGADYFRCIPEFNIYLDANFSILEITDLYLQSMNLQRDEVIGKSAANLFPHLVNSLEETRLSKKINETAPQFYEGRFWKITHSPIFDENQVIKAIFHKREDVTLSLHLNDILYRMSDGFFTLNKDLKITNVNEKFVSAFNIPFEQIIGESINKFSPDNEDRDKFRSKTMEVLRTGIPINYIESYGDKVFQMNVFQTLIGEVAVFFRDITKEKQQDEHLKVSLKMRDLFFSLASHELKTPLTSLQLQTEVAREIASELEGNPDTFRKLNWSFQVTSKGIDRLSTLVDNMLDISQISNGKLSLNLEEFCLNTLVMEIMDRHMVQLRSKGISFEIIHESDVWGRWDPFRIEQVIVNLVSNAVKYGGESPICITISRNESNAILMFQDEGPGIAKHDHDKVFQQYERIDSTNSNRGMGLGLYICQEIVERHGGEISLMSELNQGATFTVALPLTL